MAREPGTDVPAPLETVEDKPAHEQRQPTLVAKE
jgi:hypothetical protein